MGSNEVSETNHPAELRAQTCHVLRDLDALEKMLEQGQLERGVHRLGAEQEFFVVDRKSWRAAPRGPELVEALDHPLFVVELGKFMLECNLEPLRFEGDCLRRMERQLDELVGIGRRAAGGRGLALIMCGVLPTFDLDDADPTNLTEATRYRVMNDAFDRLRSGPYTIHIRGVDELWAERDDILLEAFNAAYQVHFQLDPDDFARVYNIAQLVAGPILASACNSPIFLGKRLWEETRVALFEQAADTRPHDQTRRRREPRVTFGTDWVRDGVLEVYQESLERFPNLLGSPDVEDPFEALDAGRVPRLDALGLHNGTVYRWNRPCYGISEGKPHLRIECRYLPSGPSVVDEIATSALWCGLLLAAGDAVGEVAEKMDFAEARKNFYDAARHGLDAPMAWPGSEVQPAHELLLERLIPMAREGLEEQGIEPADIRRYLGLVEARVRRRRTGARWTADTWAGCELADPAPAVVRAMHARQRSGRPVYQWRTRTRPTDRAGEGEDIGGLMRPDFVSLAAEEPVALAERILGWEEVDALPVEDQAGRLLGIVRRDQIGGDAGPTGDAPVRDALRVVVPLGPREERTAALKWMDRHGLDLAPVARDGQLVGVVHRADLEGTSE